MERPKILDHLHWIGHASYRIDDPIVIYLDPWRLPEDSPPADLILISHEHGDHCSPEDVARIRTPSTTVIANPTSTKQLSSPVREASPGDSFEVGEILIEVVPAYNIGKRFHPKEAGHVGYILTIGEERLYFAGDTDLIREMEDIDCHVALLPVSGTYVMTADQAAQAAEILNPKVAIPMHYGAGVVGTIEDAKRFQGICPVPVEILQAEVDS